MKEKIAFYGGIFLVVISLVGLTFNYFDTIEKPELAEIQQTEGVISKLDYRSHDKGSLHDLYISLKNSEDVFHLPNVSALKSHNGCYLTNIKIGDVVKIFYDYDGYNFFNGEKNDIWRIENKKSKQIILKEDDIISVTNNLSKHYFLRGILFLFMGLLLVFSCLFKIRLFCGN